MKELKEYRDEIFRRSDEKKRQIKKHRGIALGVGIPVCLCCVLLAAFPPGMSKDAAAEDHAPNMNIICDGAEFEAPEGIPVDFRLTDPERIDQILLILDGGELLQKGEDKENAVADQATPGSYRLALELSGGSTLIYQIKDDYAYCETTGETVALSSAQAQALYELVST